MDLCAYGFETRASALKQSRHDGTFNLMERRNHFLYFAYTLPDAVFATITSLPNLSASKDLSDNVWSSEQRLDSPV